jgi:hypothetical protein
MNLAEDRVQRKDVVSTVINLRFPRRVDHFLASWTTVSFSRRNLFRVVD